METNPESANSTGLAPNDSAEAKMTSDTGLAAIGRSLTLSVIAGAIVVMFVMAFFPIFAIPDELMIPFPPPEIAQARGARTAEVRLQNAVVFTATLGLMLSLFIGTGTAITRRFAGNTVPMLIGGVVLATAVSAASGAVGYYLLQSVRSMDSLVPIAQTFIVQACMLGLIGAVVAFAAGLVSGNVSAAANNIVSGIMAALVAAFLFPLISSFAMPKLFTEGVIPGAGYMQKAGKDFLGLTLYVSLFVVALGLLIPLGSRPKKQKKK
jgi:hypothetical protein